MIPSVNFHLWEPCNMRCKFCFATFQDVKHSILPKGHLTKEEALEVVQQLAEIGFEKITFAGGEPTLCPWISDLIKAAKEAGMTTMLVSNGSKISDSFLETNKNILDWIAISIDSLNPETNIATGRALLGKTALKLDYYKSLVDRIKAYGYGLKINSVISNKNFKEDMSDFISYAKPKRWKLFQVLPIVGQNDAKIDDFKITEEQFQSFIDRHQDLNGRTTIVPESNTQMKGTYAMVDPAGRFYDNAQGKHNYSKPILEIGSRLAIQQVNYNFSKFVSRGGIYDWSKPKTMPERITLSGEVASGKSTIGKRLAEKMNYEFVSIGNKTRAFAALHGLDIVGFQKMCLADPNMDIIIDEDFAKECNTSEKLIIDYRLGFKFIHDSFNILLKITEATATERLKSSGRENETFHTINLRNESFKNQFLNTYNVDYTNESNYDLVIQVEDFRTAEEVVNYILDKLNQL